MPVVRRNVGQRIQPDWKLKIAGIEIYQVIRTARGM
jgi:hypothetical protein